MRLLSGNTAKNYKSKGNWEGILKSRKGIFTKTEADALIKQIHKDRKNFKMRTGYGTYS